MTVVRLRRVDGERFLALRKAALDCDPHCFRVSSADDAELGVPAWSQRLERDRVVAIERGGRLFGVGGFTRFQGEKLDHKGLIWGMYVAPDVRGSGAADLILASLLDHASAVVRLVQLTIMADNGRARRFYERHGFRVYGIEPCSVRRGQHFADEALMWLPISAT